ncbi:MAG: MFS transporter [Planctomycetaceae bacterium]|nr:MFS transporter [Planctomycetaceae bacterium]
MSFTASSLEEPGEPTIPASLIDDRRALLEEHEPRNILVIAWYQVIFRIAWVFKTESVIMPAMIDAVSGAGWVRGFLPVLNRVGQSVPPLLMAERLRNSRLKSRSVIGTTLLMAASFAALAVLWVLVSNRRQAWMAVVVLTLYVLFSAFNGLNELAISTVSGKLIRPHRRGRLMVVGGFIGSVASVAAAVILLPRWLEAPNQTGYANIFAFTAGGFAIAAFLVLLLFEPADRAVSTPRRSPQHHFTHAWSLYSGDQAFRRAANVGMLSIGSILLFPHYRWLAAERLNAPEVDMVGWVVAQNIGVGLFSPLTGTLADRYGNRLALRCCIFCAALAPLLAILMAGPLAWLGARWFWCVFVVVGMTPVTMRTIFNYTLELAIETDHPRYLSTMRICLAVPFVVSPLGGLLLDLFTGEWRFLGICLLFGGVSLSMMLGGFLTFRMEEPRHRAVVDGGIPIASG